MEDRHDNSSDSSSHFVASSVHTKNPNPYSDFNDPSNPYRLDNGDNPVVILVTDVLTVDNYPTWSMAMRRALRAKNKLGFITNNLPRPKDSEDPVIDLWDRCNDMVVSWIQNSISPSIKLSVAFVDDAYEIWTNLQDRFSQQNGPRVFQLKKSLVGILQDTDSISIYYGKLKTLWDELSIYDLIPVCNYGTMKTLVDRYQRDCVFQFLMGLNDIYSNVRDQIMLLDPMPPVTKVFSLIQQQERHHSLVPHSPSTDSMALAIQCPSPASRTPTYPKPTQKRDRPFCTHCKITGYALDSCFKIGNAKAPVCSHCHMTRHMVDKCYKLHGYPPGHKFFHKPQPPAVFAAQSTNSPSIHLEALSDDKIGLNKAQYQ